MIFRQPRAGKDGEPFEMLKFRTMVQDAVELGRRLGISDDPFGVIPNDPRITRSGRFLRRTSLDELPQLWNVLRGQMSIVGPRPDLIEQVANYTDGDRRRLAVKPGITGWAQIQGRDEIPWEKRFALDAWYVDNWSLGLDARIVLGTFTQLGPAGSGADRGHAEHRTGAGRAARVREVPAAEWESPARRRVLPPGVRGERVRARTGRPLLLEHEGVVLRRDLARPQGPERPAYHAVRATAARPAKPASGPRYDEWARAHGVVSTFVRFHPLLQNQGGIHTGGTGADIGWRLDHDLLAEMHPKHRNVVRKAQSAGLGTEENTGVGGFQPLYAETMQRTGADPFYFFPPEYWTALDHLGEGLARGSTPSTTRRWSRARCAWRRRRGCTTTWALRRRRAGSSEGRRSCSTRSRAGRRNAATRASISAAASAAGATRCTSSSGASIRAASYRWRSARPCTTPGRTVRLAAIRRPLRLLSGLPGLIPPTG